MLEQVNQNILNRAGFVAPFGQAVQAAADQDKLRKVLQAVSAEAALPAQRDADQRDATAIAEGKRLMASEEMRCTECHRFHNQDDDATAPDLTGYGSRPWLVDFINDPAHKRFYGERNDRMHAFGKAQILDPLSIGLLADWLRGDWYEPSPEQRSQRTEASAGTAPAQR
mgnify:CR=1 FL=1